MADTLDILTLQEGRAAIGVADPTLADAARDLQLALYITATSRWVDSVAGPMVSRALLTCATNTAVRTLTLTAATEHTLQLLGSDPVDIGTAADPWAVAADRGIDSIDYADLTVTITGEPVTTTSSHTIRRGRFISTATVDPVVKLVATEHLRWSWAVERGAASRGFDDLATVGETLTVPSRVLTLLGDYFRPGVA